MDNNVRAELIKILASGNSIPETYKDIIFPTINKEYELSYAGKMRAEDVLSCNDGVYSMPLQIEKTFKTDESEWNNIICFGDNLQLLKTINENVDPIIKDKVKGKVKLIYIDPPFATEDEFKNKDGAKAYNDKVKGADFIEFMRRRLILAKEILADDGSIFVHLDMKMSNYIKIILDEIFGKNNLLNEIIWHFRTYQGQTDKYYPRKHNVIYWYKKKNNPTFKLDYDDDYEDTVDAERWKKYVVNGNEIRGNKFPKSDSRFKGYYDRFVKKHGRKPNKDDIIMKINGYVVDDVWVDINAVDPKDKIEKTGYPTQKPEQLLRRIIETTTEKGDLIFDFFGGSGTTSAVAEKLGRRWITCDLGKLSYYTIQKRIINIGNSKDLFDPTKKYNKKPSNFITCQLGLYDLNSVINLPWEQYVEFVSDLFEIKLKKNKVNGIEFDGTKNLEPTLIWNFNKYKDVIIDENYINNLNLNLANKYEGNIYIVAPANCFDFIEDYYEINNNRYYFLKIPYQIIRELHKVPFKKILQPNSKNNVNSIDESIGFHFIKQPTVKSKVTKNGNELLISLKEFKSYYYKDEDGKILKNFETLSAMFVDYDYHEPFIIDDVFFADEFKKESDNLVIKVNTKKIGKKIMLIYVDIYGNEFKEIIQLGGK